MTHGVTRTLYNKGCRCEACVEGMRRYAEKRRRAAGMRVQATKHPSASAYSRGLCRCRECLDLELARQRAKAARRRAREAATRASA